MIKKFKGRSVETYIIKTKPDPKGYKIFSLCCAETGFVLKVKPHGRVSDKEKIVDVVKSLASALPQRGKLNYVIGMDNYFTWPKVMNELRKMDVGVVGTAKNKRGWPPSPMKNINEKVTIIFTITLPIFFSFLAQEVV